MATALFDDAGAKAYLKSKAINTAASNSVDDMNNAYAIALASSMHSAEIATGDSSLKLLQGDRDPKQEAQLYANYKGTPYTYAGKTYQPATPGKSSGNKATTPNASAHSYGAAADVSGGSNPAVTVSGAAMKYMTAHRSDFGLENGSADLHIDDPAHFQIPQKVLNSIKVAPGGTIPAANDLNLSAWTDSPVPHASQTTSALRAITAATDQQSLLGKTPATKAPVPMPARPAAITGPQAAAPFAGSAATAAARASTQAAVSKATANGSTAAVTLPSGTKIAPGTYPSSNPGHTVTVNADGTITHNQNPGEIPGVIDPLHEPSNTVAGGIVQKTIQDIASQKAVEAAAATKAAAPGVIAGAQSALSTAGKTATNFLGGLFGGGAPAAGSAPASSNVFAGSTAKVAASPTYDNPGSSISYADLAKFANLPTTAYTQQQMTSANPAYLNYLAAQKADPIGAGPGSFASLQNALATTTGAPPPKTITTTRQVAAAPNEQLRAAQQQLATAGYYTGAIDGLYGPKTASAISAAQAANPSPAPAPAPSAAPPVQLASGTTVPVGTTGTAQGGAYNYLVNPDGTVTNTTTGNTSSNNNGAGNIPGFDANTGTWNSNSGGGGNKSNGWGSH